MSLWIIYFNIDYWRVNCSVQRKCVWGHEGGGKWPCASKGQVTGGWGIKVDLSKGKKPDRFHYKFFPHCSPPWTPASHEWTTKPRAGRQPDLLGAGPPLAGRARPTGAGPCAVDGCQQRSELGLPSPAKAGPPEGLQSQPHRERRALWAAQLLISLCFMFLASLFFLSCCQRVRQCAQSRSSCLLKLWSSRHAGRAAGGEQARGWD